MKLLSLFGWFALLLYLTGCGVGKDETPYKHSVCVLADKHSKVQDERYVCTVTARFRSIEACKAWRTTLQTDDPNAYSDGRVNTKCE